MARKKQGRNDYRLRHNRGVAGEERAEALAKGGQQALIWRTGGIKTGLNKDRRKEHARKACRGRVRY